jgi:hypothetical protein
MFKSDDITNKGVHDFKSVTLNLEAPAKRRCQNGQRGLVFCCSQLRLLPKHAFGQNSGPPRSGIPLAIS